MAPQSPQRDDSDPEMLDADDALEEIEDDAAADVAMDSGEDDDGGEELTLVNDSIAYFDAHKDSVFAIAQHPLRPSLVATGGSEGDADDAPGKGYVFDTAAAPSRPVLPASYSADPSGTGVKSVGLQPLFALDGHKDSINAVAFTLPRGEVLLSGGLDGRLRAYRVKGGAADGAAEPEIAFIGEAQEVPEVNWLAACPAPDHPNAVALGASDGSVWVYTVEADDKDSPLQIVQSYFLHTASCTAGAWTPDGSLLATVAEDSSLYVWDVWGEFATKGLARDNGGQSVVALTAADQRFEVDGGLYSVAVSPTGAFLAAGGAGGIIKVVGLPRLSEPAAAAAAGAQRGGGGASRARQGRAAAEPVAQAGAILASLQVQSDGVETLAFAPAPQTLLAAGSVDGSIAVYDPSRSFALRRHIPGAHDEFSVVKVEWVRSPPAQPSAQGQWLLTSCGMDGVVRRWDLRGATPTQHLANATAAGLVKEWRGHRGDGEGGGVLGFVQGETGERIVTAGDDGIVLVFEA